MNDMLFRSVHFRNLLSFGPKAEPVELRALNVLIGPNGSGKSNFLEALSLFQAAPAKLTSPVRDGGGVADWLWKAPSGAKSNGAAHLEALVSYPDGPCSLRHAIDFRESGGRFYLDDERIENDERLPNKDQASFFYRFNGGRPLLSVLRPISATDKEDDEAPKQVPLPRTKRQLEREDVDPELSILAQRRDPDAYPEITYLGIELAKIRLYREWSFGRYSAPRRRQPTDAPADFLEADCSNLGLVLNGFDPPSKKVLIKAMRTLYDGIEDVQVRIAGGDVQVVLQEQDRLIPATRLSDGTLRYLSLLAVLCHPNPPPLLCIEEPELGLHPDVLPTLATILKEASARTQIIATTHSAELIDSLSDCPEAILVCERDADGTHIERLDADHLRPWLEKFRLGQLWTRGDIGGTRW